MLTLYVVPILLTVVRLDCSCEIPFWVLKSSCFFSITKTEDELSIVCSAEMVPQHIQKIETGWRALKVAGPLDFGLTGVLSSLASPLAQAKISIFTISTFDTDYILIKEENLEKAMTVLGKFCKILR